MEVIVPKIKDCKVRQEGTRVLIISEGKLLLDLPWKAALAVSKGLRVAARLAEEQVEALKIIQDQALIQRVGFPIGLTNNPVIQKEAMKEAVHNRGLRRALPGGIKSQSAVGTPTLIKKPPPNKGGNNAKL